MPQCPVYGCHRPVPHQHRLCDGHARKVPAAHRARHDQAYADWFLAPDDPARIDALARAASAAIRAVQAARLGGKHLVRRRPAAAT